MKESQQTKTQTAPSIHPATKMGYVSLRVADLDNQILFYQHYIGLHLNWRKDNEAGLGAGGKDLIRMTQEPNLKKHQHVTGLYHVAILFPNRRELAIAMARLFALKYRNYPTDHIMTKTTYLDDPEGNGIELYAESPEDGMWSMDNGKFETRRADGSISDGREPLDVDALFTHLKPDENLQVPVPPETRVGHTHLHIRNVEEALAFYHGVLGFDIMGNARLMRAAFISAGGYHHHLGLNTWAGEGAPPPPADAVGLRYFVVELPNQAALDEVVARIEKANISYNKTDEGLLLYDPSQNGVMLAVKK